MICDSCGCSDDDFDDEACFDDVTGGPCHWVAPNLCSACAQPDDAPIERDEQGFARDPKSGLWLPATTEIP